MKIGAIHLTESALLDAIAENIHGSSGSLECDDYFVPFGKRADALAAEGNAELADAFRLLNFVTWFRLNPDDQNRPFEPQFTCGTGGVSTDDLTDEQLDVVARVVPTIPDPELRGRLADLVWVYKRKYLLAQAAVSAYTESARRLLAGDFCSHALPRIECALQISAMLGRQQAIFHEAAAVAEGVVANPSESAFVVASCLDLLLKFGIGDPKTLAQLTELRARGDESKDKPIWQRRFWELAVIFYERGKLADDARRAGSEVAKTFEAQAEDALSRRSPPSHLVAMSFLENAIQAYRRVPGTEADRDRVHRQLLECQKKAVGEICTTNAGTIDLSEIAHQSIDLVRGRSLQRALRTLALSIAIPNAAQLRADAVETIGRSPLAFLFPATTLSTTGKVVAKQGATAASESDDERESLIVSQMFFNSLNHRQVVVAGQLKPMRQQIISEHHVRYDDFLPLVAYNRLVPPGREPFFVHGLYEGLHGNLIAALHILIPQIENSLRYLLSDLGVVTSGLNKDGIQNEHDINTLLKEPRLREVFSEDMIFTLRALLVLKQANAEGVRGRFSTAG